MRPFGNHIPGKWEASHSSVSLSPPALGVCVWERERERERERPRTLTDCLWHTPGLLINPWRPYTVRENSGKIVRGGVRGAVIASWKFLESGDKMASCPRPTSSLTPTVGEAKARRTEARETSGSLGACAQRSWRGLSRGKDMLVRCYQGTPTSKSLGGKGGVLENNAYPWAQAKTHWTKVEGSKNMLNGLIKWGWGPLMGDVREWWPMALLLRNQEKKKRKRASAAEKRDWRWERK